MNWNCPDDWFCDWQLIGIVRIIIDLRGRLHIENDVILRIIHVVLRSLCDIIVLIIPCETPTKSICRFRVEEKLLIYWRGETTEALEERNC